MTRAAEGGLHRRHALLRHNLNSGSRFWEFGGAGGYMYMNTVNMIFFNLHHSGTQLFLGNIDTF